MKEEQLILDEALAAIRLYKRYYASGAEGQAKIAEVIAIVKALAPKSGNPSFLQAATELLRHA